MKDVVRQALFRCFSDLVIVLRRDSCDKKSVGSTEGLEVRWCDRGRLFWASWRFDVYLQCFDVDAT